MHWAIVLRKRQRNAVNALWDIARAYQATPDRLRELAEQALDRDWKILGAGAKKDYTVDGSLKKRKARNGGPA